MDFNFSRIRPFERSSSLGDGLFANEVIRAGYIRQGLFNSHRFEETLSSTEALRWDMITVQLIAEGVVRRRQLEDEIRRELALERELVIWRQSLMMEVMASVAPKVTPESRFEALLWRENGTLNAMTSSVPEAGAQNRFSLAPQPLPESGSAIGRFRPESGALGERFPAARQLNTMLAGIKRKVPPTRSTAAGSAAASERELSWLGVPRKKRQTSQKVWVCNICNVSCTSRESLSKHRRGKKHKAKLEESKLKKVDDPLSEFDVKNPKRNAAKNIKKSNLDKGEGALDEIDVKAPKRNAINIVGKETKLKKQEHALAKNDVDHPQRHPTKVVDVSSSALLVPKNVNLQARQLNTMLAGIKRKVPPTRSTVAGSAAASERELSWLGVPRKKSQTSQKVWVCNICNVSCTSRESLSKHRLGKKHKAKLEESKLKKVDDPLSEFDVKTPKRNAAKNVKKSNLDKGEGALDEIDVKPPKRNAINIVGKETKLNTQEHALAKNDVDHPQRHPTKVVDVSSSALLVPKNVNLKHSTGSEKLQKSNADDRTSKNVKDLRTKGRKKSNLPFRCERCGIRCNSVHMLEAHLKGAC